MRKIGSLDLTIGASIVAVSTDALVNLLRKAAARTAAIGKVLGAFTTEECARERRLRSTRNASCAVGMVCSGTLWDNLWLTIAKSAYPLCAKSSEKTTNGVSSEGNAYAGKSPELYASKPALGRRFSDGLTGEVAFGRHARRLERRGRVSRLPYERRVKNRAAFKGEEARRKASLNERHLDRNRASSFIERRLGHHA
jgi:hypothetical protein